MATKRKPPPPAPRPRGLAALKAHQRAALFAMMDTTSAPFLIRLLTEQYADDEVGMFPRHARAARGLHAKIERAIAEYCDALTSAPIGTPTRARAGRKAAA